MRILVVLYKNVWYNLCINNIGYIGYSDNNRFNFSDPSNWEKNKTHNIM